MEDLTFGEQVKIILSRKGMTIKELAELIEATTGKKMSRQNLTQRLGRDNFQEQDMRMIAAILGCPFQLSIFPLENGTGEREESMEELLLRYVKHPRVQPRRKKTDLEDGVYQQVLVFDKEPSEEASFSDNTTKQSMEETAINKSDIISDKITELPEEKNDIGSEKDLLELAVLDPEDSEDLEEPEISDVEKAAPVVEERDMTIGELYRIHKELDELEETIHPRRGLGISIETPAITASEPIPEPVSEPIQKAMVEKEEEEPENFEPVIRYEDAEENLELGEMNPYTGREYQTNSVRMHPSRIGYVQVYDRFQHGWTDMTEWAFLGYQERKKTLLGRDYEPPIYLD